MNFVYNSFASEMKRLHGYSCNHVTARCLEGKDSLPDIVAFRVSDFIKNIFFSYEMQQVSNDCALVMIF